MVWNKSTKVLEAETFKPLRLAMGIDVMVVLEMRVIESVVLYWMAQRKSGAVEPIYQIADVYQVLLRFIKSADHST